MDFYIKITDTDDPFETGHKCTVFYEVINDYAMRQVLLSDSKLVGSNRKDETLDYFLAEGRINIDDFDVTGENLQIITEKEFKEVWLKHCELYKGEWEQSKIKFKVGMQVQGEVEVIYPQGVILKLDENTIAITNYDDCLKNSLVTSVYPHKYISGKVKEYDEENMWIVLQMTRVIS